MTSTPADDADDAADAADDVPGPVRGRRPGAAWVSVTRGVHRPRDDESDPGRPAASDRARERGSARLEPDARAWQLVLPPSASFTHLTAAVLRGWWLPPLPDGLPLLVGQGERPHPPERPGLHVSRHPTPPPFEVVDGLRLAEVGETLLACARDLGLLDLVVLVDGVLHTGAATREELAATAALRRRGAPRLRTALSLADGRSESPWESMLRMLLKAYGVDVEPQHVVQDEHGAFVGRGDLWLVGTRTLVEYDGAHHLERARQRRDLRRDRRLRAAGWERSGWTREDLLHQASAVLRDVDAALGRPHDPSRVRRWHALLRESLFTPAGAARLHRRLGGRTTG